MTFSNFKIITKDGQVESLPRRTSVVALGTFDGVHVAHRELLLDAKELAGHVGAESVGAWCFSMPPASFILKTKVPMLTSLEDKIDMMLSLGLDFVAVGDFRDFCSMSAESFIGDVLVDKLGCVGAVCGYNHRFGHKGLGDPTTLAAAFGEQNVVAVPEIKYNGVTVSSSAIRAYIENGQMSEANAMLGRPFSLTAEIVGGKQLGRKWGFPTANQLFPADSVKLKNGIYATACIVDGKRLISVSNVGVRPTISDEADSHAVNCETYIHGFSGDLYGKKLTVEFYELLREEKRFDSLDALKEQIGKDIENSISYFEKRKI